MKKNYFYFFSFFLFFIVTFPLMGMQKNLVSEDNSNDSFSDLNACKDFKEFYQKYFDKILGYDQLQNIVKRFSFIFWYLKERNIGNILSFENNTYIDFQKKKLKETEINQIKKFFKDTVSLIESNDIFKEYLKKSDEDSSEKDVLKVCFDAVLKDLSLSNEFFDGRSKEIEDLTFLVKNISYKPDYIQQHVASDVHSSPEYFGLEYEPMNFSKCNFEKESLEEVYKKIQEDMKEKEVSFFCGDLADRDSLGFLDEDVKRISGQPNVNSKNFFLYNFFKDYYHTIHAAWQFYCLCNEQSNKIKRWQVFGNHETEEIYKPTDYRDCYRYFSGLIYSIRKLILPTEIYFIQPSGTVVLRHGFFTQKMNKENHVGKKIHENFKYIYLKKELTKAYGEFSSFIENSSQIVNSVYWSDHYNTKKSLDLSVLIEGIRDGEEINIPMDGSRGYYNPYSWKRGVDIGKQTSIDNFKLMNEDEFLSKNELDQIQKSHWALFCGHSHQENSVAFSAVEKNKIVSFHPYYVQDEKFLFHFCMCSHHNLFVIWFNNAFSDIEKTETGLIGIDWKSTQPVHALETYQGAKWIKEKIEENENSQTLTGNSVIKSFFRLELEKKAKKHKNCLTAEDRMFVLIINVIFNSQPSQTDHLQKSGQKRQNENSIKAEFAMQTEKGYGEQINIDQTIKKAYGVDLLRTIGAGFFGAAGFSLIRQTKSQGIKNFSKSIYDSWQQKGKFRLVLKRNDILIGGGGAAIGYALYSKFPLFSNQKQKTKETIL